MDVLGFNLVDLMVIVAVLLSGIFALARGLVREVLAIFSWVGAAFATFYGFDYVSPYARRLIGEPVIADVVAGAGIFLIVLFVLSLLAGTIAGAVRGTAAGSVDRTLGFVFGLVRGAVLVSLAYLALSWAIPPAEQPDWVQNAKTTPLMERGAVFLISLAPAHVRNSGFNPSIERSRNGANATTPDRQPAPSNAAPAQPNPAQPNQGTGYRTDQRREMDRLIQGTQ